MNLEGSKCTNSERGEGVMNIGSKGMENIYKTGYVISSSSVLTSRKTMDDYMGTAAIQIEIHSDEEGSTSS